MAPLDPLISIVGATGTGKSKLAVDLARAFDGEIINGDAMQMYKGLDVITNKIPMEERHGIPHHLIGSAGIDDSVLIGQWQEQALCTIKDIQARGKLPIIVGGTHYYIQSLLFDNTLIQYPEEIEDDNREELPLEKLAILDEPTPIILEELRRVDPMMAARWHPNNRRKIQRSLEIFLRTNRKASDIYEAQVSNSADAIKPRFKNLIFWVHSNSEVLNQRLDARVDDMVKRGLFQEVEEMHTHYKQKLQQGHEVNMTTGIWQCIGWKEFLPYLEAKDSSTQASGLNRAPQDDSGVALEKLLSEGFEKMKTRTRQYARSQIKWIRFKLLPVLHSCHRSGLPRGGLYVLDTSDEEKWVKLVDEPAKSITKAFLTVNSSEAFMPDPASISEIAKTVLQETEHDLKKAAERKTWVTQDCDVCNMTLIGPESWKNHIESRKHRRNIEKAQSSNPFRDKSRHKVED